MTETLLNLTTVYLFGRTVDDLKIRAPDADATAVRAASTVNEAANGPTEIDGVNVKKDDLVLLTAQTAGATNGIYKVAAGAWVIQATPNVGAFVKVRRGDENKGRWVRKDDAGGVVFEKSNRGGRRGLGQNSFLERQLDLADASFARIYGFSYEGTYYDLPRPTIFLVHGDGDSAAGALAAMNTARGPIDSTATGLAASDFQFAAELRVWAYDKADYSIRMDVETGMLEDILLAPFFSSDGSSLSGAKVSGAKVSGAKVSGAKVSGARVSGAKISGAKLSGGRSDASD